MPAVETKAWTPAWNSDSKTTGIAGVWDSRRLSAHPSTIRDGCVSACADLRRHATGPSVVRSSSVNTNSAVDLPRAATDESPHAAT
jgi:hypothetical protein